MERHDITGRLFPKNCASNGVRAFFSIINLINYTLEVDPPGILTLKREFILVSVQKSDPADLFY